MKMKLPWILASIFTVVSGQYSINMRMSSARIHEGGDVSATCVVTSHLSVPVLLYWVKKAPTGHEEVEIGLATHVNEDFRKTGRYQVNQEVVNEYTEFRFTLTITNAQAVDSGEIGCRIPKQNIEIFRKLVVIAQVQSVSLRSKDLDNTHAIAYDKGEMAQFNEGELRKFNCSVNGSHPEPHVKIMIGDRDLTSDFTVDMTLVGDGFLRGRYFKVELYNNALRIDHTFRGKNLTCIAHVRESHSGHQHDVTSQSGRQHDVTSQSHGHNVTSAPSQAVSSYINVNLRAFAPKFLCEHNVTASLYQSNIELACPVFAQPAADKAKFHFKILSSVNQTIINGTSYGSLTGKLINEAKSDSQKMILKIDSVYPQHFRKYYFEAVNTEGSTIHEIELLRDKRNTDVESQASHKVFSSFTANLAVFALTVIIHYIG